MNGSNYSVEEVTVVVHAGFSYLWTMYSSAFFSDALFY